MGSVWPGLPNMTKSKGASVGVPALSNVVTVHTVALLFAEQMMPLRVDVANATRTPVPMFTVNVTVYTPALILLMLVTLRNS